MYIKVNEHVYNVEIRNHYTTDRGEEQTEFVSDDWDSPLRCDDRYWERITEEEYVATKKAQERARCFKKSGVAASYNSEQVFQVVRVVFPLCLNTPMSLTEEGVRRASKRAIQCAKILIEELIESEANDRQAI